MRPFAVFVEDDRLQLEPLLADVEDAFPGVKVLVVGSEQEFRESIPTLQDHHPDVVVIDLMLPWAPFGPDAVVPPADVKEQGFHRAGIRCAELLREHPSLSGTPIIFWSVLARSDLLNELESIGPIAFVEKSLQPERLISLMRATLLAGRRLPGEVGTAASDEPHQYIMMCERGHLVERSHEDFSGTAELYCTQCGAATVATCERCNAPLTAPVGRSPVSIRGLLVFCSGCGSPYPWVDQLERRLYLENLLRYVGLEPAAQLGVLDDLSVLADSTVPDDDRVRAGRRLQRVAPKLWELGRPVLQSLLTEAAKRRLGF